MLGVDHSGSDSIENDSPTFVHLSDVSNSLRLEPGTQFIGTGNLRFVLPGDFDCIRNVIRVPVGDEHDIDGWKLLIRLRTGRIPSDPGLHQNPFTAG